MDDTGSFNGKLRRCVIWEFRDQTVDATFRGPCVSYSLSVAMT